MSLQSVKYKMDPNKRNAHCFEIFGYDYILDGNFNTWLIEANTNPCLEESSKLLEMLLPRMLNDAFKLTVDSTQNLPAPHNDLSTSSKKNRPPGNVENVRGSPAPK